MRAEGDCTTDLETADCGKGRKGLEPRACTFLVQFNDRLMVSEAGRPGAAILRQVRGGVHMDSP